MSEPASAGDRAENPAAARVSVGAGLGVFAIGAFVLCGWAWNVETFKTIYGPITMKTNTAIGLVLCGVSLTVIRRAPRLSTLCAAAAGLIGGLTLSEHLAGWNLGIDELLFSEAPGAAATASPNRMGLTASTCLVLAGVSLYRLARGDARGAAVAQALAAVALPRVDSDRRIPGRRRGVVRLARYTGIALHTALALIRSQRRHPHGVRDLSARRRSFSMTGRQATMLRRLAMPIGGDSARARRPRTQRSQRASSSIAALAWRSSPSR